MKTEWKYEWPRIVLLLLVGAVGWFSNSLPGVLFFLVSGLVVVVLLLKAIICSFSKT